MVNTKGKNERELIGKYRAAGKIRFISFTLLFLFLTLMKFIGGYSYLNASFLLLIFVEAIVNQPYRFIIERTNINRLQYYHMLTDIIAISWIIYYMGGLEAPLVSLGYYAVILWAGVISTTNAVFFATSAAAILFSLIIGLEYFGILPPVSYYGYKFSLAQMLSLLMGNISFLFAFGYFSAYSSKVIKYLQRKREEDKLKHIHRLMSAGYLVENTAHDIINYLTGIRGYTENLLEQNPSSVELKEALERIGKLDDKSTDLLTRLFSFSRKRDSETKMGPVSVNLLMDEALGLANPLIRYSSTAVKKIFGDYMPLILANKEPLIEVFIVFIMNALDAIGDKEGILTIGTGYLERENMVSVTFSDTGIGIELENLKRLGEPFFTTKDPDKSMGLGLATAYGIIERHRGSIEVKSQVGKGTVFSIKFPVVKKGNDPKEV